MAETLPPVLDGLVVLQVLVIESRGFLPGSFGVLLLNEIRELLEAQQRVAIGSDFPAHLSQCLCGPCVSLRVRRLPDSLRLLQNLLLRHLVDGSLLSTIIQNPVNPRESLSSLRTVDGYSLSLHRHVVGTPIKVIQLPLRHFAFGELDAGQLGEDSLALLAGGVQLVDVPDADLFTGDELLHDSRFLLGRLQLHALLGKQGRCCVQNRRAGVLCPRDLRLSLGLLDLCRGGGGYLGFIISVLVLHVNGRNRVARFHLGDVNGASSVFYASVIHGCLPRSIHDVTRISDQAHSRADHCVVHSLAEIKLRVLIDVIILILLLVQFFRICVCLLHSIKLTEIFPGFFVAAENLIRVGTAVRLSVFHPHGGQ